MTHEDRAILRTLADETLDGCVHVEIEHDTELGSVTYATTIAPTIAALDECCDNALAWVEGPFTVRIVPKALVIERIEAHRAFEAAEAACRQ